MYSVGKKCTFIELKCPKGYSSYKPPNLIELSYVLWLICQPFILQGMDLPHQPSHYQGNNTQRLRQAIVDFLENNDVSPQSGPQLNEADQDDKGFPMIEDKKKWAS